MAWMDSKLLGTHLHYFEIGIANSSAATLIQSFDNVFDAQDSIQLELEVVESDESGRSHSSRTRAEITNPEVHLQRLFGVEPRQLYGLAFQSLPLLLQARIDAQNQNIEASLNDFNRAKSLTLELQHGHLTSRQESFFRGFLMGLRTLLLRPNPYTHTTQQP